MPSKMEERITKAVTNWINVKYPNRAPNSIKFLDILEYENGREIKVETEFKVAVGSYVDKDQRVAIVKPYHLTLYVNRQWKVIYHEKPIAGAQEELH